MNDTDKGQFKEMLDTMFDIYNKKHADQNLLRVWWNKLGNYDISVVSSSFDKWTSNSNKYPTPFDIILLCRAKNQEYLLIAQELKMLSKPPKADLDKVKRAIDKLRDKLKW